MRSRAEFIEGAHLRWWQFHLLLVSALLCIGWSFVNSSQAMWAFALNLVAPALIQRVGMPMSANTE